jgi:dienelactone hydrolase
MKIKIAWLVVICAFCWNNCLLSLGERQISASEVMQKIRKGDQTAKARAELLSLPIPTGRYQVGVAAFDLVDESRKSLESPGGRLVPIWVYFPMQEGVHGSYPKPLEKRLLDGFLSIPVWEQLNVQVHSKLVKTVEGLDKESVYPIIIFNHGNSMHMGDFGFLVEDLASHGYVVITIQHQLASDVEPPRYSKTGFDNYALVIRNDLFVFEWLQDHNKDIFHNSLDLKRTGLIGYSMGAHSLKCLAQHAFYSYKNGHLLPHRDKEGVRECIVTLDSQRIPFPHQDCCPLFMLIGGDREQGDLQRGETADMARFHHRFCYYKGASHASFTDDAYLNLHHPADPDQIWFHGTTEERMLFFKKVRADVLSFLNETLCSKTEL